MSPRAADGWMEREPTYRANNVQPEPISRSMLTFQFSTSARFGYASMNRFLTASGLKLTFGSGTPVPSVARESAPTIWNGAVADVLRPNSYGRGSTSNIANPPRIAVFPFLQGSQEKPARGWKFMTVGLFKIGLSKPPGPHAVRRLVHLERLRIS